MVQDYIFVEGDLNPKYATSVPSPRFEIDSSSPGQYDLVILKAGLDDAGRYICTDEIGFGEKVYVELVIVASRVLCDISSEKARRENDKKYDLTGQLNGPLLRCGVAFVSNIRPSVKWVVEGQRLRSSEWREMTTEVRKVGVVESADWWTAGVGVAASDSSWFRCEVSFARNKTATSLAVVGINSDTTGLECTVQRDGLIATRNVWISSPGEANLVIQLGDVLTCLDNGQTFYPSASYSWLNLEDNGLTVGSRLKLSVGGAYRYACTASNGTHSRSRNVTITVRSSSQADSVSAVDEQNGNEMQRILALRHTVILIAVSLSLVVIVTISGALIAVLNCRRRREKYKPMRKLQLFASHTPTQSSIVSTSTTTIPQSQTVESLTDVFPVVITYETGCYEKLMKSSDGMQQPPPLYDRLYSASRQ
jgi:hypothetical protein